MHALFIQALSDAYWTTLFDFCFENRITDGDAAAITYGYGYI